MLEIKQEAEKEEDLKKKIKETLAFHVVHRCAHTHSHLFHTHTHVLHVHPLHHEFTFVLASTQEYEDQIATLKTKASSSTVSWCHLQVHMEVDPGFGVQVVGAPFSLKCFTHLISLGRHKDDFADAETQPVSCLIYVQDGFVNG